MWFFSFDIWENNKYLIIVQPPFLFYCQESGGNIARASEVNNVCGTCVRSIFNLNCGVELENAEHYLFQYRRYNNQKLQFFVNTRQFHSLNTLTFIFGLDNITEEQNS